jgi:hypothetical protein
MTRTARIACAGVAAFAIAAPAASAEDFKATYGPGQANQLEWEGTVTGGPSVPGTAETGGILRNGCVNDQVRTCDRVIFTVTAAGEFHAAVDVGTTVDALVPDIDIYLYESDADGNRAEDAEPIASSADFNQVEEFSTPLGAGTYVLEVEPYNAVQQDYTGESSFDGFETPAPTNTGGDAPAPQAQSSPPPAPAAPPAAEPQPQPAPAPAPASASAPSKGSSKAACTKKARKIKSAKKRKAALKRCSAGAKKKSKKR